MNRARLFWRSTIGKKVVMALTGMILVGFVFAHMVGNFLIFQGPDTLNAYGAFLQGQKGLLWLLRIVLLVSLLLHVTAAVQLTRLKETARPIDYVRREPQVSTLAARSIRWGGAFLLLFIIYHLLNFTVGTVNPNQPFNHANIYQNVVAAYQVWYVVLFYVLSMVALALHLYHGLWGMLQTLGLNHVAYAGARRTFAATIAVIIFLGFTTIPVAVWTGVVR